MCRCKGQLEATMDVADVPCDFGAFLAQARGISCEEADQLVESWMSNFRPRSKQRMDVDLSLHPETNHDKCA